MKTAILALGLVLLVWGVWGFFTPAVLGVFEGNLLHAIVHALSGIILIGMALKGDGMSVMSAKIFGIIYALLAIFGFLTPDLAKEYLMVNMADNILHVVLALAFLGIGFLGGKKDQMPQMPQGPSSL